MGHCRQRKEPLPTEALCVGGKWGLLLKKQE